MQVGCGFLAFIMIFDVNLVKAMMLRLADEST